VNGNEDFRPEAVHAEFKRLLAQEEARYVEPLSNALRPGFGFTPVRCVACSAPLKGPARDGYAACPVCGTRNSSPRLREEFLPELWREDGASTFFQRHVAAASAPCRARLMEERADLLARHLASGRMVEAGCSIGLFLDTLSRRGYVVEGVEPLAYCVEACRAKGLSVRQGAFESADLEPAAYDAVAAFETLAHVADPAAFLRQARRALRPDGVLLLTTPNAAGLEYDTIWSGGGAAHDNAKPHVFLQLFTPWGLGSLLEASGFTIIESSTPGTMDVANIRDKARETGRSFCCDFFNGLFLGEGPEAETARQAFQNYLRQSGRSGHMRVTARAA
jgi:SAM-dependent methyltransferase